MSSTARSLGMNSSKVFWWLHPLEHWELLYLYLCVIFWTDSGIRTIIYLIASLLWAVGKSIFRKHYNHPSTYSASSSCCMYRLVGLRTKFGFHVLNLRIVLDCCDSAFGRICLCSFPYYDATTACHDIAGVCSSTWELNGYWLLLPHWKFKLLHNVLAFQIPTLTTQYWSLISGTKMVQARPAKSKPISDRTSRKAVVSDSLEEYRM